MNFKPTSILTAILLFTVILFTGCTKDDENVEPETDRGPIKDLTASLSTNNGEWINLYWEELEGHIGRYDVYRSVDGAEFTVRGDSDKGHFWDPETERATTYAYYISYQESYSDTIEVTTAPVCQPFGYAQALVDGEGDDAIIEYIYLSWNVGSEDDIEEYDIFRDGELIATEPTGNDQYFKDYDGSVDFDQEYTYEVVSKMSNGESLGSFDWYVTPKRPDVIDRPAPEILSVSSIRETKEIDVLITDVSQSPTNTIHYKGELEDLNYAWDYQVSVDDLATDDDGNLIIGLVAEGADLPTNQTIWLKSRVRIYTQGEWSDWGQTHRFFVF